MLTNCLVTKKPPAGDGPGALCMCRSSTRGLVGGKSMQLFRQQLLLPDFSDVHPLNASISLTGKVAVGVYVSRPACLGVATTRSP